MNPPPAVALADAIELLTAPGAPFATSAIRSGRRIYRTYDQAQATLRHIFLESLCFSDRPYLVFEDNVLRYADLHAKVAAVAAALQQRFGIGKGDRVAICMRNNPEWAVAYWAAIVLGAIAVPVNAWGTGPELAYVIEHSGAGVIFVDAERFDRLAPHWIGLDPLAVIAVGAPAQEGAFDFNAIVEEYGGAALPPDPGLKPDDEATIFYTSGTTGLPKGAAGSHGNAVSCVISAAFNVALSHVRRTGELPQASSSEPPPYLYGGPLFHVGGCNSGLAATMYSGACMVLMSRWDAGKALSLIEHLRIGGFGAVPTMVWQLLEHPDFDKFDLSSLVSIAIGGAAAGPELYARLAERLPHVVAATGYGATETSGGCTFNGGLDYAADPASVGIPAPVVDVKIVDDAGEEVATGVAGELCLRGACVVHGYWGDADATAASFRDGWFHSGDIARVDQAGRITILDRAKDMVIRGGENVYCIEVEDALLAHPDVLAAAVFGLPEKILGEIVAAVVQLREGSMLTEGQIQSFAASRIAHFKVPAIVKLTTDELPKNETGKILKRRLRDALVVSG